MSHITNLNTEDNYEEYTHELQFWEVCELGLNSVYLGTPNNL